MLRFFLLLTISGKIGQKFAREVLKLAFQMCGVEIHKPEIFKLIFSRSFLQTIVEIGEKYPLIPLFDIVEAKLASKNRNMKSAVVAIP